MSDPDRQNRSREATAMATPEGYPRIRGGGLPPLHSASGRGGEMPSAPQPVIIEERAKERSSERAARGRRCNCGKHFAWMDNPETDELCSEFTLHALPLAFRVDTSWARRFVWFVAFLAGAFATLYSVTQMTLEFLEYESTTSVSQVGAPPEGLRFPAVTIWNENPVRASRLKGTKFFDDMCGLKQGVTNGTVFSSGAIPEGWNESLAREWAHQFEDMLIECKFQSQPCSAADFAAEFTPYPNSRWGVGYTFNPLSDVTTKRSGRPGGLHLVLDLQSEEYCPMWSAGFRVQLHDHADLPVEVANTHIDPLLGVTVHPGVWWSMASTREESHLLGEPYGPKCIDLRGGEEYPNPNAARDCASHCPGIMVDRITEISLLSTEDKCVIDCFKPRSLKFCDGVLFHHKMGQSDLTVPHFNGKDMLDVNDLAVLRQGMAARFVPKGRNVSVAEATEAMQTGVRKNIVVLDVYLTSLNSEFRKEVPQETFWRFIGEVGGVVGLFLGASLITGFEFIELMFLLFCSCAHRRHVKRTEMRFQAVPYGVPSSKSLFRKYRERQSYSGRSLASQRSTMRPDSERSMRNRDAVQVEIFDNAVAALPDV